MKQIKMKPKFKPTIKLVHVTPAVAGKFQNKQVKNQRPLSKRHVEFLIELFKSGEFDPNNGDCIRVDTQGIMFDGNHRCEAIRVSGISQWLWVSKGWPSTAFLTCDQGRQRKLSDFLQMQGEKNVHALAAAIRYAWLFERKKPIQGSKKRMAALRGVRWLSTHGGIRKTVKRFLGAEPLIPRSMFMGLYYVAEKKNMDWAEQILEPLTVTEGSCSHGVSILRQRLVKNMRMPSHRRVGREVLMAWVLKLWNRGDLFDPQLRAVDFEAYLEN